MLHPLILVVALHHTGFNIFILFSTGELQMGWNKCCIVLIAFSAACAFTGSAQYGVGLHFYKGALQANVQHDVHQDPLVLFWAASLSSWCLLRAISPSQLQDLEFALVELLGVCGRPSHTSLPLSAGYFYIVFNIKLPDISVDSGK